LKTIDREELKAKIDRGDDFLLLEVLGEASYNREHLQVEGLVRDRSTEVVAYCSNFN
jgi:hypothetical protein